MMNRKNSISKIKYLCLGAACVCTVSSAAVFCQADFEQPEMTNNEIMSTIFTEQNIDHAVDLTEAIAKVEYQQTVEKLASVSDDEPEVQEISGLNVVVHPELAIEQPSLSPEEATDVSIVVDKTNHLLTLYNGDSVIAQYSVGLGSRSDEGAKEKEGDKRTPEGEYYICVLNNQSRYYLSLGLSYPNANDAARGLEDGLITQAQYDSIMAALAAGEQPDWYTNLGGQIMIHGQKGDLGGQADWTNGCVAVNNAVMDILWQYCKVGTPVTILP